MEKLICKLLGHKIYVLDSANYQISKHLGEKPEEVLCVRCGELIKQRNS